MSISARKMADVNNCPRKRRSTSLEITIELNGDNSSHFQSPSLDNDDPGAKILKKEQLLEDAETNLYDLSQNSVETNLSVQEKILELQEENMKLKLQLQDVNNKLCKCSLELSKNTGDVPDGQEKPVITIKFFTKTVADLYKNKFEKFLESFVEFDHKSEQLEINVIKNNLNCIVQTDTTENNKHKRKRKKSKTDAKDLFVVDTTPSLCSRGYESYRYTSKYTVSAESETEIKCDEFKRDTTCFNCDGKHSLRDCSEPKNFMKINAARQKLKTQNLKVRYHLEDEQKYSHLSPGRISQNLKSAMGIHSNQLPEYIYRMRVIGYPPGWMEEAQVTHSDISLYDIEGKNIHCSKGNKNGSIDPSKVVEYVGFNMPIEKGIIDDHERYKCPPYSDKCSKFAMLDFINKMDEKRKDNLQTCDMEIEPSTEQEIVPPGCEPTEDKNRLSPSLLELEKKKLELLAALDDNVTNSSNGEDVVNAGINDSKQILKIKKEDKLSVELADKEIELSTEKTEEILQAVNEEGKVLIEVNKPDVLNQLNENCSSEINKIGDNEKSMMERSVSSEQEKDKEAQHNISDVNSIQIASPRTPVSNVKESYLGTPIIKSASPFTTLPNPDNFSKGVSPVINFENLPNSTGKYEQMSIVLSNVRRTLKCLSDQS